MEQQAKEHKLSPFGRGVVGGLALAQVAYNATTDKRLWLTYRQLGELALFDSKNSGYRQQLKKLCQHGWINIRKEEGKVFYAIPEHIADDMRIILSRVLEMGWGSAK